MPFVLDYDCDGNVTGGHFVEALPERLTRPLTPPLKLDPPTTLVHGQGSTIASAAAQSSPSTTAMSWSPGQASPNGHPPGPPPDPAAYQHSSQGHKQPDVVTSARFSQHASHADLHPHLQHRGPTAYQYAPFTQQHPQYASNAGLPPHLHQRGPIDHQYVPVSQQFLQHHHQLPRPQLQQQPHHQAQPAIHHPQPHRSAINRLQQLDGGRRPHFKAPPPPTVQAATTNSGYGILVPGDQTGRATPAVTVPIVPSQISSTYPAPIFNEHSRESVSHHGLARGMPRPQPTVAVGLSSTKHGSTLTSPLPSSRAPASKPQPPSRPPVTIPAPPGGIESYAKAKDFVNRFAAHFGPGSHACDLMEDLAIRYNMKALDDEDFYIAGYRIMYQHNALHLLPGFLDFFPAKWQAKDLTWIQLSVERDVREQAARGTRDSHHPPSDVEVESNDQEMKDDGYVESEEDEDDDLVPEPPITKPLPKKKRPINGFSTKDREANDGTIDPAVFKPTHPPPPPTAANGSQLTQADGDEPMPDRDTAPVPAIAANATPEHRPGLVKLKLRVGPKSSKTPSSSAGKTPARPRPQRAASISATKKRKATQALDTQAKTVNGGNHYGTTPASEIPHFGPVFPTRRSVLNRDSKPYIHLACGARFAHPGDVRTHARKGNKGRGCGRAEKWNEHPSCQADYIHIHYARVADGFVILDQESLDRLESAIQAGLAYAAEHPVQKATTNNSATIKGKKANKKTTSKKKTSKKSSFPPEKDLVEPTKYEFEFDTEGDADAEGEDASGEDADESMISAPPVAVPTVPDQTKTAPSAVVRETNAGAVEDKSAGENIAQPPEPEWEWDGTALRAAALGLRKRPRL